MEVIVKQKEELKKDKKHPYLGIHRVSNMIVFFIDDSKGFCLEPGSSGHSVGYKSDSFAEERFIIFEGEITLRND